jgi:4'-phosphopantetheinyl transferase
MSSRSDKCDTGPLQDRLPDGAYLHCTLHDSELERVSLGWLSDAELLRLDTFGSEKRRQEFLLGRAAARQLLASQFGIPEKDVVIEVGADGAPRIPYPRWRLSIAHSRDLAAATVFSQQIGVDVEPIVQRRSDLYRYLLHPDEYPVLAHTKLPHNEAQILLWSLKESVLKARRSGFQISPKRLKIAIDIERKRAEVCVDSRESWEVTYDRVVDHFLSVAYLKHVE